MAVSANPVLHSNELDLYFVPGGAAAGNLIVGEVPASDQAADILSKPLSALFHLQNEG